jgi:hypothetical protein
MNPQLEAYLKRIEGHLKGLTRSEKEGEIREIAGHLNILIADGMESGLTESEAVEAAILRFGVPAEIGRDIVEASGGQKMGLLHGILIGAVIGMAVLTAVGLASPGHGFGSPAERLSEVALGGAMASLAGRRFTRRYLTRPARALPLISAASQGLTVAYRMLGIGMLRGTIGGAIFGAVNVTFALLDPHANVEGLGQVAAYFTTFTAVATLWGTFIVGLGSAIIGALMGVLQHKRFKPQPT